ncbi:glycosyltransferase family 4 protein [Candidatus Saccharibacteria bacterium]|nr:glycosyltransferase family 4 protein [Candidatus Saccharibacteria bacterium]
MKDVERKVFLIRNVNPEFYGGAETYQLKLAKLLTEAGFLPYIMTSSDKLIMEAKTMGFSVIRAPYSLKQNYSGWKNIELSEYFLKIHKLSKWYKKLFYEYKPEVINIQSRDDLIAASGVAEKMGIKVLWTDHMDLRSWILTNVNVWYKNIIGKMVLQSAEDADKIIMISDFERKFFDKIVAPRKYDNVVTIKNGVIAEFSKYKKIKSVKNSFCFVGRVVDYKGISELIEAFKMVALKYPDVKLNIYGEGEDFEKYKKVAESVKQIVFHGQTSEPLKALAENETFVLPSYREGLSLSLLDAAMMGKMIIASDVDGNPEVVENKKTGLLVPAKNVQKLAEAMEYAICHKKEALKMSEAARKKYEEEFNLEKIFAEKMLPLYNIGEES